MQSQVQSQVQSQEQSQVHLKSLWNTKTILLILLVVLAISVPFLNKAYTIDDPFVLHVTSIILEHPLDPFYGEFDWFGYFQPVWEATTNPPLLSYYLAPFAAVSNFNEIVLHSAMILFFVLMALGTYMLAQRFCKEATLPMLFVMFSPAVTVGANVMRDVPAAALGTVAVALFVIGVDRESRQLLFWGALIAGLAFFTKYSQIIYLPLLMIYPMLRGKYRLMLWIWPMVMVIAFWCLHNYIMYGNVHIYYLTFERTEQSGIPKIDMFVGAFVIVSSIIFLLPALLWNYGARRKWIGLALSMVSAVVICLIALNYFKWQFDWQFQFWSAIGAATLYFCLDEGIRRGVGWLRDRDDAEAADSLFLFAWLCAPILFSILLVPFQATRHFIAAVPVLVILSFRAFERIPLSYAKVQRGMLYTLLVIQIFVSYIVCAADYEYADLYRKVADASKEEWQGPDHTTWFVGHWGWMIYAEKAGMTMKYHGGPYPEPGDIILRFLICDAGVPFKQVPTYWETHCEQIENRHIPGKLPLRTMNFRGASYYAVIGIAYQCIPYRFFQDFPLEVLMVYRVTKEVEESELLPEEG